MTMLENNDVIVLPGGYTQEKVTTLLLAAQGDLGLVKERINYRMVDGDGQTRISEADILNAFLATAGSSTQVMDSIKALMLLNYLQMLKEARDLLSGMAGSDNVTYKDVMSTIQMVITGVVTLMPQAPVQNNTQVNLLQAFGAENARERVFSKLETYAKVDEKYGVEPNPS